MAFQTIGDLKFRVLLPGTGKIQAKEGDQLSFLFIIKLLPTEGPLPSLDLVDMLETLDSRTDRNNPVRFLFYIYSGIVK